jgi:hypothetical protein
MPDDGSMPDTDMPLDDGVIDTPLIDMTPAAPFCDAVGEPTLVGCWEFEMNANDASGDGNNATASNVTYATGRVGMAAVLQTNSSLVVGDRASLEPAHMTVEAWIKPAQAPPASPGRWGLIDSDGAYGIFVTSTNILCSMGGALTVPVVLPVGVFTHVACTNDGTTVHVYINGLPDPSTAGGAAQGTGNASGIVLAGNSPSGDTFVGSVDQFRVFNEARTQVQICEATGLPTCK